MNEKGKFIRSIRDLFAPLVKVLDRLIFEPLRFGVTKQYNAEKYWHDRFLKFGMTLRASANRQLTEEENEVFYRATTQSLLAVVEHEHIDLSEHKVLDIGCGTGYYTRFCKEQGVTEYHGVDITDVLFTPLQEQYPGYYFFKHDVTRNTFQEQYDCILMLDVLEHIVEISDLEYTLASILQALSDEGVFIVAPIMDKTLKKLSYVRYWTQGDIVPLITGYRISTSMPFPDGTILAIRK